MIHRINESYRGCEREIHPFFNTDQMGVAMRAFIKLTQLCVLATLIALSADSAPAQSKTNKEQKKQNQELLTITGHTSAVKGLCLSPDGKRLYSGSEDMTV